VGLFFTCMHAVTIEGESIGFFDGAFAGPLITHTAFSASMLIRHWDFTVECAEC